VNGTERPASMESWMRQQQRAAQAATRRPNITHASQIMGPGLAPHAVEIKDWSGAETEFNGFFFSRPGAFNSPDGTKWWIGQSISQVEGFGIQTAWDYRGTSSPPTVKTRRFSLVGAARVFSAWA
jgi:hypothetical protein